MVAVLWMCLPGRLMGQPAFDVAEDYQTISLNLLPKAKFVVPAAVALTPPSTFEADFTGSLTMAYKVRTTPVGGGTLTVQGGTNFLNSSEPAAVIPINALRYTCGAASYGTSCVGTQTMSLTNQAPVLNAPRAACMGGPAPCHGGTQGQMNLLFRLRDDPGYTTGAYTTQLLFTFSAL